jgi:hypothetical protein
MVRNDPSLSDGHLAGARIPCWYTSTVRHRHQRKIVQVDNKYPVLVYLSLKYILLFFSTTVSLYRPLSSIIAFINALLGAKLNVVHTLDSRLVSDQL